MHVINGAIKLLKGTSVLLFYILYRSCSPPVPTTILECVGTGDTLAPERTGNRTLNRPGNLEPRNGPLGDLDTPDPQTANRESRHP